jgi:hypothetical protein
VRADIVKLLRWQAINWTSRMLASRVAQVRRPGLVIPATYAAGQETLIKPRKTEKPFREGRLD